jgi:hypothetical protein
MTMRAGSYWALTTAEGSVIRASRPMAGLLHVSPRQLRAKNLLSILGGVPGDPYHLESSTPSGWPARTVVVSVCQGQSVAMQLAIVNHQENKLWLFSPATTIRTQNSCR